MLKQSVLLLSLCVAPFSLSLAAEETAVFKDDFVRKVTAGSTINRWYYLPVALTPAVCKGPTADFVAARFSRDGCQAWFDEQPIQPEDPARRSRDGRFLTSSAPWWIDANHRHDDPVYRDHPELLPNRFPGLSYINVLGFVEPLNPVDLTGTTVTFTVRTSADFTTLTAKSRSDSVGEPGHIYLWFQTKPIPKPAGCVPDPDIGENCTRQSDYILSGTEDLKSPQFQIDSQLVPGGDWRTLSFDISTANWTCLGRGDNVKYDCLPIDQALRNVDYVGFIMAPVCTAPETNQSERFYTCTPEASAEQNSNKGQFFIDDFSIDKPTVSNVRWTNLQGTSAFGTGNSLRKNANAGTDWTAGAVSAQALTSGAGYVEFVAGETDKFRVIGLSNGDSNASHEDIDFGLYLSGDGNLYGYESGVPFRFAGANDSYAAQNIFRIAVDAAGVVKYFRNGSELTRVTNAPPRPLARFPLRVDTSFLNPTGTIRDVKLFGKAKEMADNVIWNVGAGAVASGNTVTNTVPGGVPPNVVSTRAIQYGTGYVEFTGGETNTYKMLGLNSDNQSAQFTDIDFGIYLYAGEIFVFENGVHKHTALGSYVPTDTFRVALEPSAGGLAIKYYKNYAKNPVPFHTSSTRPSYPLLVDTAIYSNGGTLRDVVLAGAAEYVTWSTQAAGVATGANGSLTKTASEGWNAGTVSTKALLSGDGYVEFTTTDNLRSLRVGLSKGNSSNSYEDIDFQWLIFKDGESPQIAVIEEYKGQVSGSFRKSFGFNEAGDRYRVAIEGGKVTYRKNGTLAYQNPVPLTDAAYPLLVDVSFLTAGAKIDNVVILGELGSSGF